MNEPITLRNRNNSLKANEVSENADLTVSFVIFHWLVSILNFEWFSTITVWKSQNEFSSNCLAEVIVMRLCRQGCDDL